jgi:dienelactone hydrolase
MVASAATAVVSREVSLDSGGVALAGTLITPLGSPITAAVVIVQGSGREPRMLPLATALARAGIAAFTYDKRGVAASGGVYAGPEVQSNNVSRENLQQLAADALVAVHELEGRPQLDGIPIGLLGISQAGWIIPLAASKSRLVKFMVLWSGPVSTVHEELTFSRLTGETDEFWTNHSRAQARELLQGVPDEQTFPDTDPRDTLSRLRIPGLWLFGDRDPSIPVDLSIQRLEQLVSRGKRQFEYRILPDKSHSLGDEALFASVAWITDHMKKKH